MNIKTLMNSGERMAEQFFTVEYVSYGFVIYDLYYVEICSLYAHFLESFFHKGVLNFFVLIWNASQKCMSSLHVGPC